MISEATESRLLISDLIGLDELNDGGLSESKTIPDPGGHFSDGWNVIFKIPIPVVMLDDLCTHLSSRILGGPRPSFRFLPT